MTPILKQVKDTIGDEVSILKVDIDKNRQAAEFYQIQGVPTLILFHKGQILWRKSGVVEAGILIEMVRRAMSDY